MKTMQRPLTNILSRFLIGGASAEIVRDAMLDLKSHQRIGRFVDVGVMLQAFKSPYLSRLSLALQGLVSRPYLAEVGWVKCDRWFDAEIIMLIGSSTMAPSVIKNLHVLPSSTLKVVFTLDDGALDSRIDDVDNVIEVRQAVKHADLADNQYSSSRTVIYADIASLLESTDTTDVHSSNVVSTAFSESEFRSGAYLYKIALLPKTFTSLVISCDSFEAAQALKKQLRSSGRQVSTSGFDVLVDMTSLSIAFKEARRLSAESQIASKLMDEVSL